MFYYPKTHKAALLRNYRDDLSIENVMTLQPSGESVLIKTAGSGICHTDASIWRGDWAWMGIPPRTPFVLSHEISGVIVACGDRVSEEWKEGQKVLVYAFHWEGEDEYTIRGLTNLADRPKHLGIAVDGGLQEYVYIPHYKLLINAEGLEDLAAASTLGCAGITAYRAVKTVAGYLAPDDYVVVIGLGGLGTYATQWIRNLIPFVNLVGIDLREEALKFSSKLAKIDITINPSRENPAEYLNKLTNGKGVKAIIDTVGSAETVRIYIDMLAKGGVYVLVGLLGTGTNFHIPIYPFVTRERHIIGSFIGTLFQLHEVAKLAKRGLINYREIVTRRYRLEEVNKALKELDEGWVLGRQIIVFE